MRLFGPRIMVCSWVLLATAIMMTNIMRTAEATPVDPAAVAVTIDDTTEGPPTAAGTTITKIADSAGEFLHFTFNLAPATAGSTRTVVRDMLERSGGTSDRFVAKQTMGVGLIEVLFGSDPDIGKVTVPAGAVRLSNLTEDGTLQALVNVTDSTGTIIATISAASDLDVPEPGSLLLLGSGLAALLTVSKARRSKNRGETSDAHWADCL